MPHRSVPPNWFHRHTDLALPDTYMVCLSIHSTAYKLANSPTPFITCAYRFGCVLARSDKQLADASIGISLYSAKSKEKPPSVESP